MLTLCALLLASPGAILAEPLDLTFRSQANPDFWLKPTLGAHTAWFAQNNAWAGEDRALLGGETDGWAEFGVQPGLEGGWFLGRAGSLRARASAIYTTTQFGLDAAGTNLDPRHPDELTLEEAYLEWASGELFPKLGKDAVELSFGAQKYEVGTGFLFSDGGQDGGRRGGYWLALRKAFELTGVARLSTGPLELEAVYLRPNDDDPDTSTDVVGLNSDYRFGDRAKLGLGYWKVIDSQTDRRDGLHVVNLRVEGQPLETLPGLTLKGEIVSEKNGSKNESWGGYAEISHQFGDEVLFQPKLSYRYAGFSGDDGKGKTNRAFDPLFYGLTDWGTWFMGEVAGEYVIGNQNLDVHTVGLQLRPASSISVNLLYYYFRLREKQATLQPRPPSSPRAALIEDRDLAHEFDFIVDWSPTSWLTTSAVIATLFPVAGGEDFFGDDDPWTSFMFSTSVTF